MYFLRHNLFDRIGSRYACSVRSLSLILVILDALHDNGDVDVDDDVMMMMKGVVPEKKLFFLHQRWVDKHMLMMNMREA